MSNNKKIININDLVMLLGRVKTNMMNIPSQARLKGMNRALTLDEQRAIAYFESALQLISSMGLDTSNYVINWEMPDSDSLED